MSEYRRDDVLRILRLPARQLVAWERAGLVAAAEVYTFDDLRRLRKLRDLQAERISVQSIRRSVDAIRNVAGLSNPLLQAVAVGASPRLAFRQGGALVDPVTRQMAFDFELARCPGMPGVRHTLRPVQPAGELQEMFLRAVRLEERPETIGEAKTLYERILDIAPRHATACINLGTIHYNAKNYVKAEKLYRRATEADPDYALAFFDLGNVLEEQQRLPEAINAYERALELLPQYADAHYNVALAYERLGEPRRALRHWTAYMRLDASGPWAAHAQAQRRRILASERLTIVCRGGKQMMAAG